jgi:hypothetical protein
MNEGSSVRIGGSHNFLILSRDKTGPGDSGRGLSVWSLFVELHAEGLTAKTSIWLGPDGVEEPLSDFFARLATDWRGWDGTQTWEGMEGGLDLHCINDRVATVQVRVVLRHLSGADWTAGAVVPVDLGQLDTVASDLHQLLTV